MENLIFNLEKKIDTTNFFRIGNLAYFEGPLLSLFGVLNSRHLYLFDWIDRDEKTNRWLIYRVSPKYLLEYLQGKISHLQLFENRPNKTVYYMDIDAQNKPFYLYDAYELNNIPENYLPNSYNFFELSDCDAYKKLCL